LHSLFENLEVTKTFPNFANRLTTNVDMQRTGTINNALNMRGLQKLPPPVYRNHIKTRHTLRGALCALICLFTLTFVACNKDADDSVNPNRMYEFYAESCGLTQTSADSVIQFSYKLGRYVTANPESQRDRYYPPPS